MTRLSEEACMNCGCMWIRDTSINDGICFPPLSPSLLSEITSNLTCEILWKEQCNKYLNINNSHVDLERLVNDSPCFFNGVEDSSRKVGCLKKSSIESKGCESIKTNSIVIYEGVERESCNEAHIIFGYSFICGWVEKPVSNSGYCGYVYYLSNNGFFFLISSLFLYFFYFQL
jgi:hypothetical protein